jgi:hypothetical protein
MCEKLRHDYHVAFKQALVKSYTEGQSNEVEGDTGSQQELIARMHAVKKHVIFVVHLSRNRFDLSSFLLDFDAKWHAVFIDSVGFAEKSGLPDLTQMLNRPLRDVVAQVDFQYVLTNQCLRPALARLIYPSKRGATELKSQIQILLEL